MKIFEKCSSFRKSLHEAPINWTQKIKLNTLQESLFIVHFPSYLKDPVNLRQATSFYFKLKFWVEKLKKNTLAMYLIKVITL